MLTRRTALLICLCAALPCLAPGAGGANWTWNLPAARYQRLNVFERAQYDKAAKLLADGDAKAAASEFEKFKVQFPDSSALSYVLFLRGYCLHQSKQRNQAIKVYNEVLDYFADQIDDAAAALYFRGMAHFENGDTRQGMQCMQEMVSDEEYRKHPLAAGALGALADNHWKNKERDQAVKCWKQIVQDFAKTNQNEASDARQKVTTYYLMNKDCAGYEAWLVSEADRDNAERRRWVADRAMEVARNLFAWNSSAYSRFEQKEKLEAMKACFAYFEAQKPWYEKTDGLWHYYTQAITFLSQCYGEKKTRDRLVDETIALIRKNPDKAQANNAYSWICDRLREANDFLRGAMVADLISDPPYASYKRYELLAGQNKWQEAVARLEQIEKMGNAEWAERALTSRANIHKDQLGQYEKAIELYRQLNKPPWTLWQIQDAFMRWGKLDEAITTLTEIENSFPDQASKAVWYKANYYSEAKQDKLAIAQARKLLKAYKESPESSLAHQLLEKYGIATGGGVFEQE